MRGLKVAIEGKSTAMAMLRLGTAARGPATWLIASGALTARTAPMVETAVGAAIDDGATCVVVDLRQVSAAEPSAVDALVAASKLCDKGGASMRLCVNGPLVETLESARTVTLFTAIEDALDTADAMSALLKQPVDDHQRPPDADSVTCVLTDEPAPADDVFATELTGPEADAAAS